MAVWYTDGALIMGAVAYDPKVVAIWDGFRDYFERRGLEFDYVLYSNYERQVAAHVLGYVDVAWNSPLAWLETERLARLMGREARALCMRDTDRDLTSVIVTRADAPPRRLEDLRGTRVGVGARDSPQATLIPLGLLAEAGLRPDQDVEVVPFDVMPGKHGDHVGGERDAVQALLRGEVEAACLIDSNLLAFAQEGTLRPGSTTVLARTPPYDHCNFTVLDGVKPELVERFRELLLGMSYADPAVRPLLDLEGLKAWQPGRTSGYRQLQAAIAAFGTVDAFVEQLGARCV